MNNGIEKITDKIIEEAKAEASKNIDAANSNAADIQERYTDKAKNIASKYQLEGEKEAQAVEQRALSSADFKDRSALLSAKCMLIDKAFDKAMKALCSMDEKSYLAFLTKQLANVLESTRADKAARAESGDEYEECSTFVLTLNATDRAKYGKELAKAADIEDAELILGENTADIAGGFILTNGSVETNCSLELLVSRLRDTLEKEVASVLFG